MEIENLKTMNERLEFLNFIETKIEQDTDLFYYLIDNLKTENSDSEKNTEESLLLCINEILTRIDFTKSIQSQNSIINSSHKVLYNGSEYTISDILKIREAFKIKIQKLKSFSNYLEKTELTEIRMAVRLKLYDMVDEIRTIHKLINQFNNKDIT
jgi:hypothetical protein